MTAHPGQALAGLLAGLDFRNFSGTVGARCLGSRPWASIGFTGARHRLRLSLEGPRAGPAAIAFLAGIGDLEVALEGHVVADLHCGECDHSDHSARLTLEALTVEAD